MATADLDIRIKAINEATRELRRISGDLKGLNKHTGALGSTTTLAGTRLSKFNGLLAATGLQTGALGGQVSTLTTGVGGLSLAASGAAVGIGALAVGLGASIKAAVSFESSFADIRKTVDLTEEGFKQLANANRQLAKELPVSVNEINRVGAIAGQLGVQGAANIEKFEKTVISLGISTGLSVEEIATSFGTLTSVLGLPIQEADRLGSALTALGNNFNSTEGQILEFSTRFAGIAKVLGIGAADVVGISNAFASVGVEAERGGTAVQRILIAIQQAAVNGGDELAVFNAVTNTTAEEFKRLVKEDPTEVFTRFVEGLKAAGDQAVPVLEALEVADARVIASFLSAANAGDLLRDSLNTSRQAALENVATQEEVAKRTATTASQFQLLKNNINDVAISIGNYLNPVINLTLRGLNALIGYLQGTGAAAAAVRGYVIGMLGPVANIATVAQLASGGWRDAWNSIASTTETVINGIIAGIDSLIGKLNDLIGGFNKLGGNALVKKGLGALGLSGDALSIPTIPTIGGGVSIPRAGGGGGGFGGSSQDWADLGAVEGVSDAVGGLTLNMENLQSVLDGLNGSGGGGGGGGGGSLPAAVTGLQALSQAFAEWQAQNPNGSIEGFVATMELAQEGILATTDALGMTAEEAFRARVDLTKLAIVLGEAGISGEAFKAQIELTQLADAYRQSGMGLEEFINSLNGFTAQLLDRAEDLSRRMRKAINSVTYNLGGPGFTFSGNLTDEGLERIRDTYPDIDFETRRTPAPSLPRVPSATYNAPVTNNYYTADDRSTVMGLR